MTREIDHTKACFVIMPFGTKLVGDRRVDFDVVYENIFEPAIRATPLPEGGHLVPVRADANFFAGDIDRLSFEHLEYSRFAIADISALNPNVFFELGVRHRARATGTAVFRLAGPEFAVSRHIGACPGQPPY